ncbi:Sin3 associated polypeptide p18-domain-containing protein [Syncephalastrum racemosum]|uniref:Sin3 associated polypeptide p18-domain-containing protein n=1 Tax=Syncephalastrum racemosum TaxID=13706 RepID=A0A1X2HHG8_SYNRA|nr:Sin3 associated polypeptide p18-domain-containing protein [Syncephalastrum racemosum]
MNGLKVDREKDCPFLLKVYTRNDGFHSIRDFSKGDVPTPDELLLYTWHDATLEEVAHLIEQVTPAAQQPDARIAFRLIYLDTETGLYHYRELGRVAKIAKNSQDADKTLEQCQFMIGDYLDVAIFDGPPPANTRYRDERARVPPRFSAGGGNRRPSLGGMRSRGDRFR